MTSPGATAAEVQPKDTRGRPSKAGVAEGLLGDAPNRHRWLPPYVLPCEHATNVVAYDDRLEPNGTRYLGLQEGDAPCVG